MNRKKNWNNIFIFGAGVDNELKYSVNMQVKSGNARSVLRNGGYLKCREKRQNFEYWSSHRYSLYPNKIAVIMGR